MSGFTRARQPHPMRLALLALLFALLVASAYGADTVACFIEGSRIHWIADYCMSRLQTDDEMAASACIDEESRIAYPDECVAKRHYKRALCELVISRNSRSGSIDNCLNDKSFAGSTVKNDGIGGRQ